MPKKKVVEIEELEEKIEAEEPKEDAFSAGASGKFDEPFDETQGKEATPAQEPEKVEDNPDDADLVDSEPEEKVEESSPLEPIHNESSAATPTASDDFDFSPPKREAGSKKLVWVFVIVLLLAAGIAGGFFMFKGGLPGAAPATPSPSPVVEATPTPMPELDRSELNIQVQNGSGVPGTAGVAKEFLEELGYKVGGTKNAASYDYDETEIMLKEDKMDYKDQLIKDLSENYVVSDNVETLDEDSDFDAIVIIGEKTSEGGE